MRLRKLKALCIGGTTIAAMVFTGPGPASATPDGGALPADPAVQFLMERYDLDRANALARIAVQDRAVALQDALDAALGDSYGGIWLDQAAGGAVFIGVRPGQAAHVRRLSAASGLAQAVLIPVARSLSALKAVQAAIRISADGSLGLRVGGIYSPTNQVNLRVSKSARHLSPDPVAKLKRTYPGAIRVVDDMGSPMPASCISGGEFNVFCDAPLRGGVGIFANLSCSAGFNVRSVSDGLRYLLSAGHCNAGGTWQTRFANGEIHTIGIRHNSYYNANGDAMIITINNPTGWNPQPWVFVDGDGSTVRNETYPIARHGSTMIDMTVCMTGQRDGTECGQVIDVDREGAGGVLHVAEVEGGCIRGGDSGGAVYRNSTAFGIVHGGIFPNGNNNFCSITWLYQGVRDAMSRLNVRLVTTTNP